MFAGDGPRSAFGLTNVSTLCGVAGATVCRYSGVSMLKGKVRSLTVTGNSADFRGTGRLKDGTRVNFEVTAADNGDGTSDTCFVSLNNGYTAGGNLIRGDIRIN